MPETRSGQRIAVFQQRNSAEAKIAGIRRYGGGRFHLECFAIDQPLPDVLDDTSAILPDRYPCRPGSGLSSAPGSLRRSGRCSVNVNPSP